MSKQGPEPDMRTSGWIILPHLEAITPIFPCYSQVIPDGNESLGIRCVMRFPPKWSGWRETRAIRPLSRGATLLERGHSGAGLASGELLIPDIDFSRINEAPRLASSLSPGPSQIYLRGAHRAGRDKQHIIRTQCLQTCQTRSNTPEQNTLS